MRTLVIGPCGAGKTTFAQRLARATGVPHVELDALHWEPGWTSAPLDAFRARVDASTSGAAWVVDGNYSVVRDLLWPRATTAVWLDYGFPRVASRLLRRTLRRALLREVLWAGNRETLRKAFCSRDSILLWLLQTYGRRRRTTPELLRRPEYAHLRVERVRTPREAEALLARLAHGPS